MAVDLTKMTEEIGKIVAKTSDADSLAILQGLQNSVKELSQEQESTAKEKAVLVEENRKLTEVVKKAIVMGAPTPTREDLNGGLPSDKPKDFDEIIHEKIKEQQMQKGNR